MRRSVGLLLFLCLGLSACNLPAAQTGGTATPNANAVATEVAGLLTAMPSVTAAAPTLAPSVTAIIPTAVSSLTSTSAPAGPTSTPAPTLTPTTSDPATLLGEPAARNNLDSGRGFGLGEPYDDDNVRIVVENGALTMTGKSANGWHSWRLTSPKLGNVYIETTARTRSCSGSDTYGLVFRAPDFESGKGYYFGFTCDGRYYLGKWPESGLVDIIDYTQSDAIITGSNQTNRVGVKIDGKRISLYANGKLLQEIDDDAFQEAGYYGLFIAPNKTAGFAVDFDQIAYWNLP
ncbi:MAG TPA: hypothetical protein VIO36_14970 [Anaerolineaceae bacterium]